MMKVIGYWVFTILIACEMVIGAYWDLFQIPYVKDVFVHLHLPFYFLIIIGIWRLPCAVILLIPGLPKWKVWAYGGAFFMYSGAMVLHLSVGDGVGGWLGPLLYTLFTVASWMLRPASRRLMATAGSVVQGDNLSAGHDQDLKKSPKSKLVVYWIITVLVALSMISGGIAEIAGEKTAISGMISLGYPVYFTKLLGYWKIAGGIVILAPGLLLVKEWAYLGIFLDLTGAFLTHLFCHSEAYHVISTGIFAVLTFLSWALRPSVRKIAWRGL
ncbi:MAG TPA: DoxX family protein [Puia sp.]|nr:DoxX family protein [Puia sp.]